MINSKVEKNGLLKSQRQLFKKIKSINRLFLVNYTSLVLVFLLALGIILIWFYLLFIGEISNNYYHTYGVFGPLVFYTQIILLLVLTTFQGFQIFFYGKFIIRANKCLKPEKKIDIGTNNLYMGITPYINNLYNFFNRFSKKKINLSNLIFYFLFLNILAGTYIIVLLTRLIDFDYENPTIRFYIVMIFLLIVCVYIINFITSLKIRVEVNKWERIFPKLEEWGRSIEYSLIESSNVNDKEDSS